MPRTARSFFTALTWIVCLALLPARGAAVTGSFEEPFIGSPPFANLICCESSLECSEGDDVYENCRMPDSAIPNAKLCGYGGATREEYPYVCDYCPGAPEGECDGGGWVEVADGEYQCDGPVYRGVVGSVRQIAPDTWYVVGAGSGAHLVPVYECNGSYGLCESASCFEPDCISCSTIDSFNGLGACQAQPMGMCHAGALDGSTALLCCSEINGACIRPNATTGDCTGSPSYDSTYTTLASCTPCPDPDIPDAEEICHGWDLANDFWPAYEEELLDAINCSQQDEAGCNVAIYGCDGTLVTTGGIELENACLLPACDGI